MTRSTGSAITIWEAGYLIYSYCEVGEIDFNRIKELDLSEGPGFYQWRMDKIDRYLSRGSLYGPASDREKAFWLEKAASVFAVSYLLGCTLLAVLVQGMISGFAELRLPIQLWSNEIPYGVNMGQVCLLWSLMILCIGAALVSIMLFTSALTKSTIGTMSLALLLLIVPAFLPYSKDNGLFNRLLELCFVRLANVREVMGKFISYQIGSLVLDQLTMGMLVWGIVAAVLLIPLRRVFVTQIVK